MNFFKHTLSLVLILIAGVSFAQQPTTGSVSGKLVDGQNKPVSYATVALLRADSSVVNGDLSKDDGSFSISPTGIGSFRLKIESIGVQTKMINIEITEAEPNKKMGNIKLSANENTLNAVSITGEKAVMEMKVDKKVFNVDKNTTTAGGSASDVLQNVPAVSVDADGNVSLRGKSNVTILIDGKPATMLGTDVASALQSLPAGSIESVEVITNPSAKYDAQGTTGIVNIITKKDGRFGMNGNITLGAGTRDKYNGNLGLNARKGKWNVFLNSSFRVNNTWNDVTNHRQDKDDSLSTYSFEHVPRLFWGSFNSIGATYDFDKRNSLTVTQNVNFMDWGFTDDAVYNTYPNRTESGTPSQSSHKYSEAYGGPVSFSSALDYKHKFKKKDEELSIDGTYSKNTITRHQNYTTDVYTAADTTTIKQLAPSHGGNSTLTAWADYTDPILTKNGKLGLGFKSQIYNFYSSNTPTVQVGTEAPVTDSSTLTSYNYDQQIHAAYANWSDQVGKFSYQAGLRAEDAEYNGEGNMPTTTKFHNSFFNFFPSAFVSYQLTDKQSIYLNYSRRTNRPGFFQMMPYKDFSNPGTVSMGNPDLQPEFINNIEFSYNIADKKGNNVILSTYFANTQNLTERVVVKVTDSNAADLGVTKAESGLLLSKPVNIASGTTFGVEGTGRFQFLPMWDGTVSANFFRNELYVGKVDPTYNSLLTNNSGYAWFAKFNTNIKLPKGFSFQVNANYESPKVVTQGSIKESYWIDLALKKTLWKNKASLVINCSDVLKTRQFITTYNTPTYDQYNNRLKETRIGNITFTYRFGKSDFGKTPGSGMGGGDKRGRGDKEKPKTEKPSEEDRGKNLKQGDDDNGGGGGGGNNGGGQGGKGKGQ